MKKIGCDHYETYEYYDIKDLYICCTCKYCYDNELETRFECHAENQSDECYEARVEE